MPLHKSCKSTLITVPSGAHQIDVRRPHIVQSVAQSKNDYSASGEYGSFQHYLSGLGWKTGKPRHAPGTEIEGDGVRVVHPMTTQWAPQ